MNTNAQTQDFQTSLDNFCKLLQDKINEHYKKDFAVLTPPTITVDIGSKYIRIVRNENNANCSPSRSVWGFVNRANGDILKAAGWKAPAKHARGSIYNQDPWQGMGVYGPHYL
jgi:hypothetical protein